MDSKNLNRQLYFLPALLSIWLIVSSTLVIWLDRNYFLIFILFLIVVTALCLSHKMRIVGWVLALIGSSVYFVMHMSGRTITGEEVRIVSIGVAALLGDALLSTFAAEQFQQTYTQLYQNRKMIEELRIIEPVTGLTRFHYARRNLNNEVARCQRYGKDLSLIIARVSNWNEMVEHRGIDAAQQIMAQVGEQFRKSIRNTDLAFINIEKIGVILPETKAEGAIHVARRVLENCSKKVKVDVNIGLANFPGDAEQDAELLRVAEAALQISISSGQSIVTYAEIQEEMDRENPADVVITLPARKREVPAPAAPVLKPSPPGTQVIPTASPNVKPAQPQPVTAIIEKNKPPLQVEPPAEKANVKPLTSLEHSDEESYIGRASIPPAPLSALVPVEKQVPPKTVDREWVPPFIPGSASEKNGEHGVGSGKDLPHTRQNEVLVGIHGVKQLSDLPEIEREVSMLPHVLKVEMMDYTGDTLVLKVSHNSPDFLVVLKENWNVPYTGITSGDAGIEISLK